MLILWKLQITTVHVARGPTLTVKKSTDILIVLNKDKEAKYNISKDTKEIFQKIIEPAIYNMNVNKISSAHTNSVHIEALTIDLPKIKKSCELADADLQIMQGEVIS